MKQYSWVIAHTRNIPGTKAVPVSKIQQVHLQCTSVPINTRKYIIKIYKDDMVNNSLLVSCEDQKSARITQACTPKKVHNFEYIFDTVRVFILFIAILLSTQVLSNSVV